MDHPENANKQDQSVAERVGQINNIDTASSNRNKLNRDRGLWRDLLSYWIFGLCNNYGYVIILTSAYDILKDLEERDGRSVI
jgi:hypothetical protein